MLMFQSLAIIWNFNPRSLAGATSKRLLLRIKLRFQSTLPRGSDVDNMEIFAPIVISIHAPSRERPLSKRFSAIARHFNPRSLAGATFKIFEPWNSMVAFQSTLPRGSDTADDDGVFGYQISIHAPSRERRFIR